MHHIMYCLTLNWFWPTLHITHYVEFCVVQGNFDKNQQTGQLQYLTPSPGASFYKTITHCRYCASNCTKSQK